MHVLSLALWSHFVKKNASHIIYFCMQWVVGYENQLIFSKVYLRSNRLLRSYIERYIWVKNSTLKKT